MTQRSSSNLTTRSSSTSQQARCKKSLDQLEATHHEENYNGEPIMGIYHFDLIKKLKGMAENHGYTVEIYDMFAANNKCGAMPGVSLLRKEEMKYGERAIEAHILRRVFTNIRLLDMDDDKYTTNLAISFHQKGIQVGMGNMVKICHNQCMLGTASSGAHYASTYGERGEGRGHGLSIPEIIETVGTWFDSARQDVYLERERIEEMQKIEVTRKKMFELVGLLTSLRIACDTKDQRIRVNKTYPLNQAQINQWLESLMVRYTLNDKVSVWDLYNCATELYKAHSMEMPNLLTQNIAMTNFLAKEFEF